MHLKLKRRMCLLLAVCAFAGCSSPVEPTATAGAIASAGATSSSISEVEALARRMQSAVDAADAAAYLALVDLRDPVFAVEHERWVADWAADPVPSYTFELSDLAVDGPKATALAHVSWRSGDDARSAQFQVLFTNTSGTWKYAGENWLSRDVEHFTIRQFGSTDDQSGPLSQALPQIYDQITGDLGFTPSHTMEIKLYPDSASLVATTMLSLPEINGWNEPGEALKLWVRPQPGALELSVAHEFTHFMVFDRAGTKRSRMPWWLDEGLATFEAAPFDRGGALDDRMSQVRAWAQAGELVDWSKLAVFEQTPRELWPHAYSQGFAMVRYVTEQYGTSSRNRWLAAMATDLDIAEATRRELSVSFAGLDRAFRLWLVEPPGATD